MKVSMTAADLLKWVAWGDVTVHTIWGFNNQATDLYIQLHQTPPLANGTLTAGTVPAAKSLLAMKGMPFYYGNDLFGDGITLAELLIAISSTEPNYTAVGAAGGLELYASVSGTMLCDGTEVVVGDLTTGVDKLQVFADTGAPVNKLLRATYVNNDGADRYLLLAPTYVVGGPFIRSWKVANGDTLVLNFGDAGFIPHALTAANVDMYGLKLWQSADGNALTQTITAASYIRAIYKPI